MGVCVGVWTYGCCIWKYACVRIQSGPGGMCVAAAAALASCVQNPPTDRTDIQTPTAAEKPRSPPGRSRLSPSRSLALSRSAGPSVTYVCKLSRCNPISPVTAPHIRRPRSHQLTLHLAPATATTATRENQTGRCWSRHRVFVPSLYSPSIRAV